MHNTYTCGEMARGNQRELAREKAAKRDAEHADKSRSDGLTPQQRRERDGAALQEKARLKAEKAAAEAVAGGGASAPAKK